MDVTLEHRYAAAIRFARKRAVLDAGCSTGAGTAVLAAVATWVAGIDGDETKIALARERGVARAEFAVSSGALPLGDASVDLVVDFRGFGERARSLAEYVRVLRPDGLALVAARDAEPFDDFRSVLEAAFANVRYFSQRTVTGSSIAPLDLPTHLEWSDATQLRVRDLGVAASGATYVALCSQIALDAIGPASSFYPDTTAPDLRVERTRAAEREDELERARVELSVADADRETALVRLAALEALERQLAETRLALTTAIRSAAEARSHVATLERERSAARAIVDPLRAALGVGRARIAALRHDVNVWQERAGEAEVRYAAETVESARKHAAAMHAAETAIAAQVEAAAAERAEAREETAGVRRQLAESMERVTVLQSLLVRGGDAVALLVQAQRTAADALAAQQFARLRLEFDLAERVESALARAARSVRVAKHALAERAALAEALGVRDRRIAALEASLRELTAESTRIVREEHARRDLAAQAPVRRLARWARHTVRTQLAKRRRPAPASQSPAAEPRRLRSA